MSGRYLQYSPAAGGASPHYNHLTMSSMSLPMRGPSTPQEHDSARYLKELVEERQKLGPFMQVLPICSRLLNQEILRLSTLVNQGFVDHDRLEHGSPMASSGLLSNGGAMDLGCWPSLQSERMSMSQASSMGWHGAPTSSINPIVKKLLRIDVPVDKFPHFNFVGRLLGPRGNSLKRVEASTDCRVYIRGRGSVKDSAKEEKLRDKPGYEHLNEPLHVLVEAELPANIIDTRMKQAYDIIEELLKPVDESHDFFKKQQLRELAILNGTYREDSPRLSGSVSPFNTSGKRPKTGL
eukprot:TRINITY_DN3762_c0_g1_i1.p1 TRINITY_DN3762_c0_g1~~TRINITY_DN3762_c0_g1_i1.p1  ORF type:complete len:294 (+),score=52.98 TRINITY_DN3762_c0_g1_i1:217-1098(+)